MNIQKREKVKKNEMMCSNFLDLPMSVKYSKIDYRKPKQSDVIIIQAQDNHYKLSISCSITQYTDW